MDTQNQKYLKKKKKTYLTQYKQHIWLQNQSLDPSQPQQQMQTKKCKQR